SVRLTALVPLGQRPTPPATALPIVRVDAQCQPKPALAWLRRSKNDGPLRGRHAKQKQKRKSRILTETGNSVTDDNPKNDSRRLAQNPARLGGKSSRAVFSGRCGFRKFWRLNSGNSGRLINHRL